MRIPDPQRRGGPCDCSRKQHSSVYLVTIIHYICNIVSFYIFYASSVALNTVVIEETIKLKQNMNQNNTFKRLQVLFLSLSNF